MSESDELIGFALEALDEIDALVGYGHDEFAASVDRQRAAGPARALVVPDQIS
ncbi:MAG: hypothetical protein ABR608_10335 [Pseudonocardiaceae bacterium]